MKTSRVIELAQKAKQASALLSRLSTKAKNQALLAMASEISRRKEEIFLANRKDLEAAQKLVSQGKMAESARLRLKLDEEKLKEVVAGIKQVAALEDPVGKVLLATQMDEGLELYRVTCPVGVIGVIFESRPDALPQIVSLCLKSSNAAILKGGSEAENSNRILFSVLQEAAVKSGIPGDAFTLLESREEVNELLEAAGSVDLIIPRGSNALVQYIQEHTKIPVLGHAEGICHIYIDDQADPEKAIQVSVDAKVQYPAACNAVETVLIHRKAAGSILPRLVEELKKKNVEVRCEEQAIRDFRLQGVGKATEADWKTEYLDLILSIKVVASLREAIEHINTYGSHHTDAVITENPETFETFFARVDSAGVYLNASTRFSDGFRYGFGAEVGISTGKLHPRGPVGLEGLVTYKYKILGNGQTVSLYSGANARKFAHRKIQENSKASNESLASKPSRI